MLTRLSFCTLAALMLISLPAAAQGNDGPKVAAVPAVPVSATPLSERIERPMQVIDPVTLHAEGLDVRLWGIDPVTEQALGAAAMERLEALIAGQRVNCKIEKGAPPSVIGRCAVPDMSDLSIALLNDGLALRNRRQTMGTLFAQPYSQAEESARAAGKGLWASSGGESASAGMIVSLLIGIPLVGFSAMGLLLWMLWQRFAASQRLEFERARKKETALAERERSVLLSMLEGELVENKNKVDAFLTVYGDMLNALRTHTETPKYRLVGDIIQRYPSFSHIVFDANVNKLSSLGMQLAGRLSKLYAAMARTQEYITLDPAVPLETAIKLVEKTVGDAEALAEPLSTTLAEVQAAATQKGREG